MKRQERRRFGNYWIIELLGQGGFADVYLGEHVSLRTPAAIKVCSMTDQQEKKRNGS